MQGKREEALELDMLATDTDPRSPSPLPLSGSIRYVERGDLSSVARLLEAIGIDLRSIEVELHRAPARYHLLVLDIGGDVRGVEYIVMARDRGRRGRLQFLVIDPVLARTSGRAIQDRMTSVAIALCEAYGCTAIDIAAASRDDVAAVRQLTA